VGLRGATFRNRLATILTTRVRNRDWAMEEKGGALVEQALAELERVVAEYRLKRRAELLGLSRGGIGGIGNAFERKCSQTMCGVAQAP
jgi:hypothetical protein